MCGKCLGYGILGSIFAAIFAILFFNGIWLQLSWSGAWGSGIALGVLFVQYIVAFFFMGAAKITWMKGKESHDKRSVKKK